jgi:hypothetical protein
VDTRGINNVEGPSVPVPLQRRGTPPIIAAVRWPASAASIFINSSGGGDGRHAHVGGGSGPGLALSRGVGFGTGDGDGARLRCGEGDDQGIGDAEVGEITGECGRGDIEEQHVGTRE